MANSYVDDIKVKISEKYKPPFRISLPISYSQRLILNKELQDNKPNYDFQLEKTILIKIREWKDVRKNMVDERKETLFLAKKQFDDKIQEERLAKLEQEQAQARQLEDSVKNNSVGSSTNPITTQLDKNEPNYSILNNSNPQQQNYVNSNGILIPTPVSIHLTNTNILKPVQLQNTTKPFNISDFESDTSSPFDNMELKSINDLEELAQVLKTERNNFQSNVCQNTNITTVPGNFNHITKSYAQIPTNTKSYSNFPQGVIPGSRGFGQNSSIIADSRSYGKNMPVVPDSKSYNQLSSSYSQVNSNFNQIPTSFSQYNTVYNSQNIPYNLPTGTSTYNNFNGYLYNPVPLGSQVQLGPHSTYNPYNPNVTPPVLGKTNCKSVPDLVKSLEKELDNTHLSDSINSSQTVQTKSKGQSYTTNNVPQPVRPKSTDSVYPKTKTKEDPFNPFDRLSRDQKDVCKNVSVMGFPLDRVARVCLIFGSDQKKIVDHLLALSDLLDLGFSEKIASDALAKNDNDRDKALDLLIS